jgi:amino acid adenylation domain-containing protein
MEGVCLHEIFEGQVDTRPADPALLNGQGCVSYVELDQRANRLARHLRSLGARPGARSALYLIRGELPIVAILAVLKTGAAYVPIDPAYPPGRIRHILNDADVDLLVTESALAEQAASYSGPTRVVLDAKASQEAIAGESEERLSREETGVSPANLCYVIYTSGTTGRPKGIMTEHRNVVAFTSAFKKTCELDCSDRVYQGFSLGFDGSVEEIWMALSNGAALVVGPPELARLGDETARFMARHGVTFFSTVPTILDLMGEDVPSLRLIVVSGEQCPPELVRKWVRPGRRLLNVYGPTETTVNTTAWDCVPESRVKIGRPLSGYETYILDGSMQPVPQGEPGELYIGGAGVARGYLNQDELTRAHFVANPFNGDSGLERLYRTGDLVSEDDEGELLFLGRIDGQVKVRGYRIELAEIESALRDQDGIEAAAVKVVEMGGLSELAAYVVTKSGNGASLNREDVLDQLRQRLPVYMIPGYLDAIGELPTLASGKVDRSRLPDPCTALVSSKGEYVAPRTDVELKIAQVWETLFKTAPISIEDDFFQDLRGYSLLAAQLVSRLRN